MEYCFEPPITIWYMYLALRPRISDQAKSCLAKPLCIPLYMNIQSPFHQSIPIIAPCPPSSCPSPSPCPWVSSNQQTRSRQQPPYRSHPYHRQPLGLPTSTHS